MHRNVVEYRDLQNTERCRVNHPSKQEVYEHWVTLKPLSKDESQEDDWNAEVTPQNLEDKENHDGRQLILASWIGLCSREEGHSHCSK